MDQQHLKIRGYRDLSQQEIDLMNSVKALGEELGNIIAFLRSVDSIDKQWVDSGEMDLKVGIMKLVRSIAQPTSF